jgi:hypothetical protein
VETVVAAFSVARCDRFGMALIYTQRCIIIIIEDTRTILFTFAGCITSFDRSELVSLVIVDASTTAAALACEDLIAFETSPGNGHGTVCQLRNRIRKLFPHRPCLG